MTAEYRITFTIERAADDSDDWQEVGFGSSGAWHSIDSAEHDMGSIISSRSWETEPGMPDPGELESGDPE
ncbi:hypothetical protein ACQBAU_16215 [Propionibacteriaceae bacterium Y2011]